MNFSFRQHRQIPRPIIPLEPEHIPQLRLRADSVFESTNALHSYLEQLARLPGNPDDPQQAVPLAYARDDGSEYIIGGRWRRRNDIGELHELSAADAGSATELIEYLLDAFRKNTCELVLLGFGEHDRARSFYTRRGWLALDEVVYYERRAAALPEIILPNNVLVRLATHSDIPLLVELDHLTFPWLWWNSPAEMRWYYGLPDVEICVLEDEQGELLGYSGATMYADRGHLDRLAVHPGYQGRGYGAVLLHHALQRMTEQGAREVALSTQMDNNRSQRLYARFGFRRSRLRFQVYGHWISENR